MNQTCQLNSGQYSLKVSALGAQMLSWKDADGQELLLNGSKLWTHPAPIMFPIVGFLPGGAIIHKGKSYSMPCPHGFAMHSSFELLEKSDASCLFSLTDSEATWELYPFKFEMLISYSLERNRVGLNCRVKNPGDEVLPFSWGLHAGFVWPLDKMAPKEDHYLQFEYDEPAPIKRVLLKDGHAFLRPDDFGSPIKGRRLYLKDQLFEQKSMILDRHKSRSLIYGCNGGRKEISLIFPDFYNLTLWSIPGENFICPEPCCGTTTPLGFTGDIMDKPGLIHLAPGAVREWNITLAVSRTSG